MKNYDVIILGSGPIGVQVSTMLDHTNLNICVVEAIENNYGGTCVNQGCMPTKQLVKAAEIVSLAKKGSEFGVEINGIIPNMEKIFSVKSQLIQMLGNHHKGNTKCDKYFGYGRFLDNHTIQVTKSNGDTEEIYGKHIIIGTGSKPKLIPDIKIDGQYICTSDEVLNNSKIPENFLVIGAGVIGSEFASIYNNFGSKVTLVEAAPFVLPNDDKDTSLMVKEIFQNRGIEVFTSTFAGTLTVENQQVRCKFKGEYNEERYFDQVLVCIGRQPNTDNLGLENTEVQTENNFIQVNEYLQTTEPHIYAGGDVIPTWMLAHTAAYEGMIIASNIIQSQSKKYTNNISPRVVYSSPEVATVGLTEKEASENYELKILNFPMQMNGKAIIEHAVEGRFKLIFDKKTECLLGANIIGKGATEIIHELTLAVTHHLTLNDLKETIHAHPTLSESIWFAALNS